MNSFEQLQLQVQTELQKDYQLKKISLTELMSALYLLGTQKDEISLKSAIEMFSSDYEALNRILSQEQELEKSEIEQDIQMIITRIISENPKLASEVAKIASKKGVKQSDITDKFPELKIYFK